MTQNRLIMNDLELYEKIEAYLKKRLSPEAQRAFEEEIAADPALAGEVALHGELMAATGEKDVVDLRLLMEEIYLEQFTGDTADGEEQTPDTATKRPGGGMGGPYRRLLLAAVAVILLGIAIVSIWKPWQKPVETPPPVTRPQANAPGQPAPAMPDQQVADLPPAPTIKPSSPTPQQAPVKKQLPVRPRSTKNLAMAREYYDVQDYSGQLMGAGEGNAGKSDLEISDSLYMLGKYREAAKALANPPAGFLEQALYRRGHAHFAAGNYKAAAADFLAVVQKETPDMYNAKWYAALSLLAQKGPADSEVRRLLNDVVGESGAARKAKAQAILATGQSQ